MQESPRVGVRWSIISLNGLSYKDAGDYRCQARNMAGISEALIKLKVVGVTRLSRPPKKKSQKTQIKLSSKYKKPNQTPATINIPPIKVNLIQVTSPSINKYQTVPNHVSKVFPIDKDIKRRRINLPDVKKKTQISTKSTLVSSDNSTTVFSETLVWDLEKWGRKQNSIALVSCLVLVFCALCLIVFCMLWIMHFFFGTTILKFNLLL